MFWLHMLLFLALLPIAELVMIVRVGHVIGAAPTFATLILAGFIGVYIARKQGAVVLKRIFNDMQRGQLPADALLEGALIIIGGLLLVIPGFVSDLIGVFCFIPYTRAGLVTVIKGVMKKQMQQSKFQVNFGRVDQFGSVQWTDYESEPQYTKKAVPQIEAQIIPIDFSLKRRPDTPDQQI